MIWTTLFDILKKFIEGCLGAGRTKAQIVEEIQNPGPFTQFLFENELREKEHISRRDWRRGKREEVMGPIYADLRSRSKAEIEMLFDETQKPDWFAVFIAFLLALLFTGPVRADDAAAKAAVAVAMAELELAKSKTIAPVPVPAPTPSWIEWNNGWSRSTISGHWSHPYWGHKDKDFDWGTWTVTREEQTECDAWMRENGHTAELPNQHHLEYMQKTAWQLKQQHQYQQPAQGYAMPVMYQMMQSYGGGYGSKGRFKLMGRGAGCSSGG